MLDLRNNPGGVVQAALEAASLFLAARPEDSQRQGPPHEGRGSRGPEGRAAVQFPGGGAGERENRQRGRDRYRRAAGSRSRHRRRAPRYGKGLVQNVFPLTGNTAHGADHGVLLHAQRPVDPEAARDGQLECENAEHRVQNRQGRGGDRGRRHSAGHRVVPEASRPLAGGAGGQRRADLLRHRLYPET